MMIAMLESVKSFVGCTAWPYALRHAVLVKNIIPHSSLPDGISPYKLWTGNKPSVSTIHTFGCKASLTIPDKQCNKLLGCSISGYHLGLAIGKKAFVMYDPNTQRVHESHDVHFFEGMSDSEQVTIEVPGVESPSHVVEKGRDDGDDVEVGCEDIVGEVEGDEEEEKGDEEEEKGDEEEEKGDEGPVEPQQSGCEC